VAGKRDVESRGVGGERERERERERARVLPNPRLPPHPGERYTHSVFHAFRRRSRITQRPNLHCRRHRTKPSPPPPPPADESSASAAR